MEVLKTLARDEEETIRLMTAALHRSGGIAAALGCSVDYIGNPDKTLEQIIIKAASQCHTEPLLITHLKAAKKLSPEYEWRSIMRRMV